MLYLSTFGNWKPTPDRHLLLLAPLRTSRGAQHLLTAGLQPSSVSIHCCALPSLISSRIIRTGITHHIISLSCTLNYLISTFYSTGHSNHACAGYQRIALFHEHSFRGTKHPAAFSVARAKKRHLLLRPMVLAMDCDLMYCSNILPSFIMVSCWSCCC